jgi:hypothetical protein
LADNDRPQLLQGLVVTGPGVGLGRWPGGGMAAGGAGSGGGWLDSGGVCCGVAEVVGDGGTTGGAGGICGDGEDDIDSTGAVSPVGAW